MPKVIYISSIRSNSVPNYSYISPEKMGGDKEQDSIKSHHASIGTFTTPLYKPKLDNATSQINSLNSTSNMKPTQLLLLLAALVAQVSPGEGTTYKGLVSLVIPLYPKYYGNLMVEGYGGGGGEGGGEEAGAAGGSGEAGGGEKAEEASGGGASEEKKEVSAEGGGGEGGKEYTSGFSYMSLYYGTGKKASEEGSDCDKRDYPKDRENPTVHKHIVTSNYVTDKESSENKESAEVLVEEAAPAVEEVVAAVEEAAPAVEEVVAAVEEAAPAVEDCSKEEAATEIIVLAEEGGGGGGGGEKVEAEPVKEEAPVVIEVEAPAAEVAEDCSTEQGSAHAVAEVVEEVAVKEEAGAEGGGGGGGGGGYGEGGGGGGGEGYEDSSSSSNEDKNDHNKGFYYVTSYFHKKKQEGDGGGGGAEVIAIEEPAPHEPPAPEVIENCDTGTAAGGGEEHVEVAVEADSAGAEGGGGYGGSELYRYYLYPAKHNIFKRNAQEKSEAAPQEPLPAVHGTPINAVELVPIAFQAVVNTVKLGGGGGGGGASE